MLQRRYAIIETLCKLSVKLLVFSVNVIWDVTILKCHYLIAISMKYRNEMALTLVLLNLW